MSSYYVVMQDMDYDNNHILFISPSENIARIWCNTNTNSSEQISISHYIMSEDAMIFHDVIYSNTTRNHMNGEN